MERGSADTIHGGPRARRTSVRAQSMGHRRTAVSSGKRFETPAWLDHSFVLPVQEPVDESAAGTMPVQQRPDHDDLVAQPAATVITTDFVRPASEEIDFVRVVKLADACRLARRTATYAVMVALLALTIFMLTRSSVVLPLLVIAAAGGVGAASVTLWLRRAPIPRVRG